MRKWLIGAGIAVAAIGLVLGGAAFAASQAAATVGRETGTSEYRAFMGGRMAGLQQGGMGRLRFGGELHDYVFEALAGSLSLTVEELEAGLADGQVLSEIAVEQGVTEEALPALLEEARSMALAAAVEDRVLTQEQADWMMDHPAALRMLAGMRRGWGDQRFRGPMGWGSFGRR